jgi:UDP-N-acetylglucosamine 3-dehydrogenase
VTALPDTLGVLFLGCGQAATIHSRVLRRMPGVHRAYASRDGRRAEAMRSRFDGRRAFASYEAGLADPDVHVAIVATPTATHRALALEALRAGKHVIVEKPAFMCAADADAVADAAAAAGRRVFVAENYVYKPLAAHLRRLVESGSLGDPRFLSINATKRQPALDWRGDPALSGGGALYEGGVHWISFASNLGLQVEALDAWRVGDASGPDRSTLVVLRYAGGAVATIAHSWEIRAPLGGLRLSKLQGTRGAVTFESNGFAALTTGHRPSLKLPALSDPLGYRAMHEDFAHAIRTGAPTLFTLAHARRDLALLELAAARMASRDRGAVPEPVARALAHAGD